VNGCGFKISFTCSLLPLIPFIGKSEPISTLENTSILGLTSPRTLEYSEDVKREQETTPMLITTTTNTQIIRNYLIAAIGVMMVSLGVADMFYSPSRLGQQDRLNSYSPYISAGLVSYGKSLAR
jgi:hypothetical protein